MIVKTKLSVLFILAFFYSMSFAADEKSEGVDSCGDQEVINTLIHGIKLSNKIPENFSYVVEDVRRTGSIVKNKKVDLRCRLLLKLIDRGVNKISDEVEVDYRVQQRGKGFMVMFEPVRKNN